MNQDKERGRPGQEPEAASKAVPSDSASVAPYGDTEWRKRLAERVARVTERRERARTLRAAMARRRAAGKRIRHATRGGGR